MTDMVGKYLPITRRYSAPIAAWLSRYARRSVTNQVSRTRCRGSAPASASSATMLLNACPT